jgi:hypothetical protein
MLGMKRSARSERAWAKWRRLVAEQEASGLSVQRFCRRRGIPASSLFAWRRKVREAAAGSARRVGFVELVPEGAAGGGRADHTADRVGEGDPARGGVVVELVCGRRIIVQRGFACQVLAEVVRTLESIGRPGGGAGWTDGAPGRRP